MTIKETIVSFLVLYFPFKKTKSNVTLAFHFIGHEGSKHNLLESFGNKTRNTNFFIGKLSKHLSRFNIVKQYRTGCINVGHFIQMQDILKAT